jgi:hypothetical protein
MQKELHFQFSLRLFCSKLITNTLFPEMCNDSDFCVMYGRILNSVDFLATSPGPTDFLATSPGLTDFLVTSPGPTDFLATSPGLMDFLATSPGLTDFLATSPGLTDYLTYHTSSTLNADTYVSTYFT